MGLVLVIVLVAYWVAFDVYVTQTPSLQRPDLRQLAQGLGPPAGPRAIVTWKLSAAPVEFYLNDGAQPLSRHGGVARSRRDRQISVGGAPGAPAAGLPPVERLNSTASLSRATWQSCPIRPIRRVAQHPTGFGRNAVVIDGEPSQAYVPGRIALKAGRLSRLSPPEPAPAAISRPRPGVLGRRGDERLRIRRAARRGRRHPANWWQLLKFGIVGVSGYLINLASSPCWSTTSACITRSPRSAPSASPSPTTSSGIATGPSGRRRHPAFQAFRFFAVSLASWRSTSSSSRPWSPRPHGRPLRPGDRRRGGDAVQLPRQQALDLRLKVNSGASAPVAQWSTVSARRPKSIGLSNRRSWVRFPPGASTKNPAKAGFFA